MAEPAYLGHFLCSRLRLVSAYCAFSGVKRYCFYSRETRFAPLEETFIPRTYLQRGWVNQPYADASHLGRWHHVLGGKGCLGN